MAGKKNLFIVGPTASGKSDLAHELALLSNSIIISADSRQSYKYLDIGTAKPSEKQLSEVVYKNISILDPKEKDNPKLFLDRCTMWTENQVKTSIYVGGSTLYQTALLFGLDDIPNQNEENILHLESLKEEKGIAFLFDWLEKVDPIYSKKMDGMNTQRIYRALDVFMQTGKPFSFFHTNKTCIPENWIVIYPIVDKETLKERISKRVHLMIENGLLNEVQTLLNMGYSFKDPGLQTIGYQEWEAFLENKSSLDNCISTITTRTWQYAKRQITWLKRWPFLHSFAYSPENKQSALKNIIHHLDSN